MHTLVLACGPARTSTLTGLYTHTNAYSHTYSDRLFFTYLMIQPMFFCPFLGQGLFPECLLWENSFQWSGSDRCFQRTQTVTVQNSRRTLKRKREGESECIKTRWTTDDKARGGGWYVPSSLPDRYIYFYLSLEWIFTIQNSSHFQLHQMCKAVCFYKPFSPFVMLRYKLLCISCKSTEHHLEGNGFCFLW